QRMKNTLFLIFLLLVISPLSQSINQDRLKPTLEVVSQPIQLIYPDEQHQTLQINQNALSSLNELMDNYSILGVVGTFHSGKSFLLNQLMDTTDRFTVGPTIHPQTLGIWVWPTVVTYEGKRHPILLIDTEGFYSSNVSEAYDAKIFAITTLLSSHLIYNSVKIIDQSALEYLELLARRTQLFALKSQLKTDSPLNDILKFPSLTWVVQDFFQDIGEITATQWLHNLLKAHSRDQPDANLSIAKIFPDIQCHTLFIPSSDRNTLRHLDQAKIGDLSPIYLDELNTLKKSIFHSIKPKMQGPAIGSLIKLLVEVANGNTFPTVPSVWVGFIKQQQSLALSDSLVLFKEKMAPVLQEVPPLNDKQYSELESSSLSFVNQLYKQLLFGLEEAYTPGLVQLKLSKQVEMKHNENVEQMKLIVMESLNAVKTLMKSRLGAFWFQHRFINEAREEAEKRIINKIESKKLRDKVINQFIHSDLEKEVKELSQMSVLVTSAIIVILLTAILLKIR
ncbi:hypothetical protein SAMD00019534_084200, partial [Acytostelium subglobosum LB1]|uniref:hypothetical protein n=1 Tax=Acytostelium subglobosum LB1 TaxID=1410327 RepID=UPI000644FFAE